MGIKKLIKVNKGDSKNLVLYDSKNLAILQKILDSKLNTESKTYF